MDSHPTEADMAEAMPRLVQRRAAVPDHIRGVSDIRDTEDMEDTEAMEDMVTVEDTASSTISSATTTTMDPLATADIHLADER